MASEATPLENELVAFVEGHEEIFSLQDVVNMRRKIIFSFGMVAAPKGTGTQYTEVVGLSGIASAILIHISSNITKKTINTSQDIKDVLIQFESCVEFINKFLTRLCDTERSHHFGSGYNSSPTPKIYCETMRQCIIPYSSEHYTGHGVPNIFELVKKKINEYHSRVLKLWTNVLIQEEKITPEAVAEMKAAVSGIGGYEQKMRGLFDECYEKTGHKPNLDDSMLLKWLTLFHVANIEQLTKTYDNLGSLDRIIFGIISQFMSTNPVYGYSYIPQSNKQKSELNILHLTCNVIEKNPQKTQSPRPPVMVYLSSEILDECVQSIKHFPTTDEFLSTRMIKKVAVFESQPPSDPHPSDGDPSAPPLHILDAGKKTRRKTNKKLKKFKKGRRRFIKTYRRYT